MPIRSGPARTRILAVFPAFATLVGACSGSASTSDHGRTPPPPPSGGESGGSADSGDGETGSDGSPDADTGTDGAEGCETNPGICPQGTHCVGKYVSGASGGTEFECRTSCLENELVGAWCLDDDACCDDEAVCDAYGLCVGPPAGTDTGGTDTEGTGTSTTGTGTG